jgi:manganese/zinc/iron transport system permease protein
MTLAQIQSTPLIDIWSLLTWQVPHNTAVVLRGVIVLGVACGAIGTFLLLRKRSLVADALSHAALPGVCAGFLIAFWLGMEGRPLWILLIGAAVAGLLGVSSMIALNTIPRIKQDAAIGVVLSVFFAVGVVMLGIIQHLPAAHRAGLHHFIFGQAATMRAADSNLMAALALLVLVTTIVAFKELRLLCFDAAFAQSAGFPRLLLDGLLLTLIVVVTVVGLHAVGALLMVALLIIPAAAARFWTDRLGAMVMIAAVIGGLGAYGGAAASAVLIDLPTGPAIIIACGILFAISMAFAPARGLVIEAMRRWMLARHIARHHVLRAMYEHGEIVGDEFAPVRIQDLLTHRRWSAHQVSRLLQRLQRREEVAPKGRWSCPDRRRACGGGSHCAHAPVVGALPHDTC